MQSRIQTLRRLVIERQIYFSLKKIGIPKNKVEHLAEEFGRKPSKGETYYYYNGPLDEKTRPFCRRMLELDKVFALTDIEILSNYLGYDVLDSSGTFGPGAFNCRHHWVRFRGREIESPPVTIPQIRDLISKGINLK